MSIYYSPLRYPGGKNCIFTFVSEIFTKNKLIGINYAEPYAGGAGLALRLLIEGYVKHIYINDLDKSIYAFWISILDRTSEFCEWIEKVDVSIENWKKYRNIQFDSENVDNFELAKSTFFLNRTNISGVIKGGVIGGLRQNGKYKIGARFNKKELINRIQKISQFKKHITVTNLDGISFIKKLNRKKEDIFIYLDPPYYQKGSCLYMNFYSKEDHINLAEYVQTIKKKWMISYDNHDFILNLYTKQRKIVYKLPQSASNRIGDEVLIISNSIKFKDAVNTLRSPIIL